MALIKRNTVNYATDGLTLLTLLGVASTGLLLKFVLPPGSGRTSLELLGMSRHEWGDVHFWTTVALGAVLLLHIALHWNWVCGMTHKILTRRTSRISEGARAAWGVVSLALIVGLLAGVVLLARANLTQTGWHASDDRQGIVDDARHGQGKAMRSRRRHAADGN
jgi:hypothetical protein